MLKKKLINYGLGRGVAAIGGMLMVFVLAKFMAVNEYAQYSTFLGIAMLAGVVTSFGLDPVIARYVSEAKVKGDEEAINSIVLIVIFARMLGAIVFAVILYVFWHEISLRLKISEHVCFYFLFFLVCEVVFQTFQNVFQAVMAQENLTKVITLQSVLRIFGIGLVIWISGLSNLDVEEVFEILACSEFICVLIFCFLFFGERKETRIVSIQKSGLNWNDIIRMARNNFFYTLLSSPPQGYFMRLLVSMCFDSRFVAAYGFFLSLSEKIRQYVPMHFFFGIIEPVLVRVYVKSNDFREVSSIACLLYKTNILIFSAVSVFAYICGWWFIGWGVNDDYVQFNWVWIVILLYLTLGSHVVLLQLIQNVTKETTVLLDSVPYSLIGFFVVAVSGVVFNSYLLIFAPMLHVLVMNFYATYRLNFFGFDYRPIGDYAKTFAVVAGGALFWGWVSEIEKSLAISLTCAAFAVVSYFAIAIKVGILAKTDFSTVKTIFSKGF